MAPEFDNDVPLAHSSAHDDTPGDPYARHVQAVRGEARTRAEAILCYAVEPPCGLQDAIEAAATFHDLGKLDPYIQSVLREGRSKKLRWDHIDAGVAHLSTGRDWMAAWLVRAHHAPGLPQKQEHFNPDNIGRRLRGRRRDNINSQRHDEQIERTNCFLQNYLDVHEAVAGKYETVPRRPVHGLTMRLALSCLVDADHTDTAFFDTGSLPPTPINPRWQERFDHLCHYVRGLPAGKTSTERARNRRRSAFFDACLNTQIDGPMLACEGPVGLGKTTAVTAYLIRRAIEKRLRRLIVVAPYTNILTQTARQLRKALVLQGERPDHVVVEHHHRADFDDRDNRHLAVLWQAPVVLTTAVSFFETLAACDPASLRKLHAVPGSAIFLDEAHAALPTKLWPQNWRWLQELAEQWGCRIVFASGSLARFWENKDIIREPVQLPELLPANQAEDLLSAERHRIRYAQLRKNEVVTVEELIGELRKISGPRLVIMNTVQNAAIVAMSMREAGLDVLHLSTALTPYDRSRIVSRIVRRLKRPSRTDWTLVATSCVEAGVDFSFRCAFRERFATASTLQVGGRVNRHGEYDADGGGIVFDIVIEDKGITRHPAACVSAEILRELMLSDALNCQFASDLVTEAMRQELLRRGGLDADPLLKAEESRDYPAVREHGRVIDADTRLVLVDPRLIEHYREGRPIGFRQLLRGSVQLWIDKIAILGLDQADEYTQRRELYLWSDLYDPTFLGIMAGILRTDRAVAEGGGVI